MPVKNVLLCSLDGVRPDAIAAAATPNLDRLVREGAHTWAARTVMPSITLTCHTSMLRGVDTARHGITTHIFQPLARPVPSLIEVACQHGLATGFSYNWEAMRDVADPLHLNLGFFWRPKATALDPAERGEAFLRDELQQVRHLCHMLETIELNFFFLYLVGTDVVGHASGWMSPKYLGAVAHADRCLGMVQETLAHRWDPAETCTLVLSDHGGHEQTHGTEMPEDMTIPWILHGAGVRRGHTITGPVRIYDTCVTLAHLLGLPRSSEWEGRVIAEALVG